LANGGRRANLATARQLLMPAHNVESTVGPAERAGSDGLSWAPTFVCRHCGQPMTIVQLFERAQGIRAPPPTAAPP
jgi:hypothetical protein